MPKIPFYQILGYAGLIPMLWLTYLSYFQDVNELIKTNYPLKFFYSVMIISFLAGIHWPIALKNDNSLQLSLSMLPTIFSFALAFLYVTSSISIEIALNTISSLLVFLLWMDYKYLRDKNFPKNYFRFRCIVTFVFFINLITLSS